MLMLSRFVKGLNSTRSMGELLDNAFLPHCSATPHFAMPFLPIGIDWGYNPVSQFRSTLRSLTATLDPPAFGFAFIEEPDANVRILNTVTGLHTSASLTPRAEDLVWAYTPSSDSATMSFHMVLYISHPVDGTISDGERWPHGKLYHDGHPFRREALSVSLFLPSLKIRAEKQDNCCM